MNLGGNRCWENTRAATSIKRRSRPPLCRSKSSEPIKTTREFITYFFYDHVGFPLRPFTDLFIMHAFITIPLCIQLNFHWAASNQCPEIIVVRNGKLNLDWVATSIIQSNHFKRPSSIKRRVIMSNQCPQITVVVKNHGKLNLYWAATAIKQSLPLFSALLSGHQALDALRLALF